MMPFKSVKEVQEFVDSLPKKEKQLVKVAARIMEAAHHYRYGVIHEARFIERINEEADKMGVKVE